MEIHHAHTDKATQLPLVMLTPNLPLKQRAVRNATKTLLHNMYDTFIDKFLHN